MGKLKPGNRILLLRYPKWIVSAIWSKPTEKPLTVGSMGLFSETLPLSRGNNYISFAAEGEAKTTTVIKQVPQQVKSQLQRMIALPGMGAKK